MNLSCTDILLFSAYKWNITCPSLVTDIYMLDGTMSNNYWINVQLCWGDFDSLDIEHYTVSEKTCAMFG
ncbi:hypothetical protein EDC04DRAFT_2557400 [Pisolithus marmoratus]|nr:hypothetical protein EDC04DRAFT_2557400 [Pisolithus marmoratus]